MAHYLVIRLSAIGDVAMTIPVLYPVAKANPDDSFTVLTQISLIPLFINPPENVKVIGINTKTTEKSIGGLIKFIRNFPLHEYDVVLDLHNVLRTIFIHSYMQLKGKKVYILDKTRKEREQLTRRKNKIVEPLLPVWKKYSNLFQQAGLIVPETFLSLFKNNSPDLTDIPLFLEEKNIFRIGIAPFAKHKGKIYPIEKMEEIILHLSQKENIRIFLLGGKGEEEMILNQWAKRHPNIVNIAGQYPLNKELAIISRLHLLISMDSANMHFASLVNTRVVSIWGSTHPFAGFYGYGQRKEDAIQLSLECRPCSIFGNKPCYRGDWACMTQLSPQTIIKKIEEIISGNE